MQVSQETVVDIIDLFFHFPETTLISPNIPVANHVKALAQNIPWKPIKPDKYMDTATRTTTSISPIIIGILISPAPLRKFLVTNISPKKL